jgi:hypothetical protein
MANFAKFSAWQLQHFQQLEIGTQIASPIGLDLKDLTLAGQDGISFLERCEADGITLTNCAGYVREWITRQRRGS